MQFPLLVLDASAALALLLAEKDGSEVAEVLEDTINSNGQVLVPGIFWYELGNGLLDAERRRRLSRQELTAAERCFSRLPIVTHTACDEEDRQSIFRLARKHELSFYDSSYLELALRHQATLVTCDVHLMRLKGTYPQVLARSSVPKRPALP